MAKKKKKATHYNGRPLSERTKFVIALPRSMPVTEVIERAAAAGLTISKGLAHSIRQKHKDKISAGVAEPAKKVRVASTKPSTLTDNERDLLGLVLEVGYSRAASLLDSFRIEYFDKLKRR
jgi:hypothetical protein